GCDLCRHRGFSNVAGGCGGHADRLVLGLRGDFAEGDAPARFIPQETDAESCRHAHGHVRMPWSMFAKKLENFEGRSRREPGRRLFLGPTAAAPPARLG